MTEHDYLRLATAALPQTISTALATALDSGDFVIGALAYESELAVCPIVAAAITAGVWRDGAMISGAEKWGTPEHPSDPVEEFAAWFDLCAEASGLDYALAIIGDALTRGHDRHGEHAAA